MAAVLWPIYVGIQVEEALREGKRLSLAGLEIHHVVLDWQRDLYRSRAISRIHVLGQEIDFKVNVEHDIRHRLLGVSIESRLKNRGLHTTCLNPWQKALLESDPRGESWVGLRDGIRSRLYSKPVQITWSPNRYAQGSVPFYFEAGPILGGFSYSPERAVLSLDTERLTLSNGRATLELDGLHHTLVVYESSARTFRDLPNYDYGLGVGRTLFRYDGRDRFDARALRASSSQNQIGDHSINTVRLRGEVVRVGEFALERMDLHLSGEQWSLPDRHLLPGNSIWPDSRRPWMDFRQDSLAGTVLDLLHQPIGQNPALRGRLQFNFDPEHQHHLKISWVVRGDGVALNDHPAKAMRLEVGLELAPTLVEALQGFLDPTVAEMDLGESMQKWLEERLDEAWGQRGTGPLNDNLRKENERFLVNGQDVREMSPAEILSFIKIML